MIVAIIGLTAIIVLTELWIRILDDERYRDDADFCYGCTNVWCDRVPETCERGDRDEA